MRMEQKNCEELLAEIEKLSLRAEEAEQTIQAIQKGEVDAVYVDGPFGEQVYTLKSVDHTYKQIVEEMNQGSLILDEEGIILYGNRRLEELFKKPLEKVIGSSIYEYVEKKDQQLLVALIHKSQDARVSGEISFKSLEGDVLPSYLAINPLIVDDEAADVKVLSVVLTDLTEQKKHEEIVKSEKFSRTILEQAGRAIVVCDEEGQIIRANEMAQELSNVNPLLKPFDQVFPLINIAAYPYFGDKSKYEDSFSIFDVLQGELHVEHEVCYISPSENKIFFLLLSSKPLKIEDKNAGAIITLADITEKREFEKKIVHLNLVLKAIRNVNQLITHEKDVERLINQICNTLIENRGYGHALIFISDNSDSIIAFDSLNFDKSSMNTIQKKLKSEQPECMEKVFQDSNVIVTKKTSLECSNCLLQEFMGNKGCMIARIEHAGKIYGFLNVSLPAVLADYEEEQSLFIEVAGDIAFALHTIDVEMQRKETEQALRDSEEKFREVFNKSNDAITLVSINKDGTLGQYIEVNDVMCQVLGYSREELLKMTPLDIISPDLMEEIPKNAFELLDKGHATFETVHVSKDGHKRPVEISDYLFTLKGKKVSISTIHDLTERKKAEKRLKIHRDRLNVSLKLYKMADVPIEEILDYVLEASLTTAESKYAFIGLMNDDESVLNIHNWSQKVMNECAITESTIHFPIADAGIWGECVRQRRPIIVNDYKNSKLDKKGYPSGHVHLERFIAMPIFYGDNIVLVASVANKEEKYDEDDLNALNSFLNDMWGLIQRINMEKNLINSLREKETLLKEIHHRVKNNMQIISSLLSLQSDYVGEKTANVLEASQNRVKSMALVHEKLYRSSSLSRIDMADYIRSLVPDLFYNYARECSIEHIVEVDDDIKFNIETAIPCGLIINELVSNSLKYAFQNIPKGELYISLKFKAEKYELIVKDNGIGLPEDLDLDHLDSLGLKLVNSLVDQLDGEIEIDQSQGTKFTITFKELNYKKRI